MDRLQARAADQGEQLAFRYLLDGDVHGEVATLSFTALARRARAIGAALQAEAAAGAQPAARRPGRGGRRLAGARAHRRRPGGGVA